jgi:hypothetical protein
VSREPLRALAVRLFYIRTPLFGVLPLCTYLAGIDNARIHDLRHPYASVASGVGLYLTGKILGHLRNTTTERYAHLADDPVRQANDLIGRRIQDAMTAPAKRIGLGTTP